MTPSHHSIAWLSLNHHKETSEKPIVIDSIEPLIENFTEFSTNDIIEQDKQDFMNIQTMQKQLLDTMILMQQKDSLRRKEKAFNIGTQININNMNVDMTSKQA